MEAVGSPAGGDNPELARRIAAQHPIGTHILMHCSVPLSVVSELCTLLCLPTVCDFRSLVNMLIVGLSLLVLQCNFVCHSYLHSLPMIMWGSIAT